MLYEYDEGPEQMDSFEVEDKIRNFFKEGPTNLTYPEFLQRITDDDSVLKALFTLGKIDYMIPCNSRRPELIKQAMLLQSLIIDTAEEMVKEGLI